MIFNDYSFHTTGIEAILIFEGQICNCFTVPLSIDNSACLSHLSKIAGEVNLANFPEQNKRMVRCRNSEKILVVEIFQSPLIINKPLLIS